MRRAVKPVSTDTRVRMHWPGRADPPPRTPRDFFTDELHAIEDSLATNPLHATLFDADNADALTWLDQPEQRRALSCLGGLRLAYLDPPYATQAVHGVRTRAGDAIAYDDRWTLPQYLSFMHERFALIRGLLEPDGALFVQCDWRANSHLRLLLDEVFGPDCFRNEIVWRRAPNLGRQARSLQLGRTNDSILVYTRTPRAHFRGDLPVLTTPVPLTRTGAPLGARRDDTRNLWYTLAPRGDYTDDSIARLRREGRIHTSPSGTHYVKYFLRTLPDGSIVKEAPADTIWDDDQVAPLRHATRDELSIGYTTQKPESLLSRIIRWSTREGDLVADFFAGSGTTLACAHKLGRRWIGCDNGSLAIHTIRKRMLAMGAPLRISRCEPRATSPCHARASRTGMDASITLDAPLKDRSPAGSPTTSAPRVTRRKRAPASPVATPELLLLGIRTPEGTFRCFCHAHFADGTCKARVPIPNHTPTPPTTARVIDPLGRVAECPLDLTIPTTNNSPIRARARKAGVRTRPRRSAT